MRIHLSRLKSTNEARPLPFTCEVTEDWKVNVRSDQKDAQGEPIVLSFISVGTFCLYYQIPLVEFVNELGVQHSLQTKLSKRGRPAQPVNEQAPIRLKSSNAALTAVTKPLKTRKSSSRT